MKIAIKELPIRKSSLYIKILLFIAGFLIFYLVLNYLYFGWSKKNEIEKTLKGLNIKVIEDLGYQDGEWNTSLLTNDREIEKDLPLYILTSEGFIIDRRNKINGFLDISDFRFSSSFKIPQEILSPTGQKWRMFSKLITDNGGITGTITLGYFEPEFFAKEELDAMLLEITETITSQLVLTPNGIDLSNFDSRLIDKKIAYEIVDIYNRSLTNYGGIPSYIDRSYTGDYLQEETRVVTDEENGTKFLLYISPINKDSQRPIGTVISGYPLTSYHENLTRQMFFSLSLGGGIIITSLILILVVFIRDKRKRKEKIQKSKEVNKKNGKIKFDKDKSVILFGEKKVSIPYASNQYYVVLCLLGNSRKRFECDEILERMGESKIEFKKNWRKIYDATRAINEKSKQVFGNDLIIVENKTFRVNPTFLF